MRRRFLSRALSILLCLAVGYSSVPPVFVSEARAAAEPDDSGAKELIDDGIEAYQAGKYDEAVSKLTQARKLAPTNSPTVLYLGLAYLKQGKTQQAIDAWQAYVNLPPTTETERTADLDTKVTQYLTLLTREENERLAKQAIANESKIGPGDPNTVAVTYFKNLGTPDIGVLQKGLTALLINDLSKVKGLSVVERDRLQAVMDELQLGASGAVDKSTAPQVGKLLGAGRVATGSYIDPKKQQLKIDAIVADTSTARSIGNPKESGKLSEFYELEKSLALGILADLGYPRQRLQDEGVLAAIQTPQTTSLPALTSFSKGLDAKDRQDYATARTEFDQALKEDPNFELPKKELLALPLVAATAGGIAASVSSSAPTASAATAGMAAASTGVISGTALAIGAGVAVVAGGVAAGVAASGGGGGSSGGSTQSCNNGTKEGSEACDQTDFGSTSRSCPSGSGQLTCNTDCTINNSACTCGNGTKQADEQCDGSDFGSNGSSCPNGQTGTRRCTSNCTIDDSGCEGTQPGCNNNGVKEGSEECDGGDLGGATCNAGQQGTPSCTGGCKIDNSSCRTCTCTPGQSCNGGVCGQDCQTCSCIAQGGTCGAPGTPGCCNGLSCGSSGTCEVGSSQCIDCRAFFCSAITPEYCDCVCNNSCPTTINISVGAVSRCSSVPNNCRDNPNDPGCAECWVGATRTQKQSGCAAFAGCEVVLKYYYGQTDFSCPVCGTSTTIGDVTVTLGAVGSCFD